MGLISSCGNFSESRWRARFENTAIAYHFGLVPIGKGSSLKKYGTTGNINSVDRSFILFLLNSGLLKNNRGFFDEKILQNFHPKLKKIFCANVIVPHIFVNLDQKNGNYLAVSVPYCKFSIEMFKEFFNLLVNLDIIPTKIIYNIDDKEKSNWFNQFINIHSIPFTLNSPKQNLIIFYGPPGLYNERYNLQSGARSIKTLIEDILPFAYYTTQKLEKIINFAEYMNNYAPDEINNLRADLRDELACIGSINVTQLKTMRNNSVTEKKIEINPPIWNINTH